MEDPPRGEPSRAEETLPTFKHARLARRPRRQHRHPGADSFLLGWTLKRVAWAAFCPQEIFPHGSVQVPPSVGALLVSVTTCPFPLPRRKRAQREDRDMAQRLPVSPRGRRSRPGGGTPGDGTPSPGTGAAVPVGPVALVSFKPDHEPAGGFLLSAVRSGSTVTADYWVTVLPLQLLGRELRCRVSVCIRDRIPKTDNHGMLFCLPCFRKDSSHFIQYLILLLF